MIEHYALSPIVIVIFIHFHQLRHFVLGPVIEPTVALPFSMYVCSIPAEPYFWVFLDFNATASRYHSVPNYYDT
jgi:hypothetical protein